MLPGGLHFAFALRDASMATPNAMPIAMPAPTLSIAVANFESSQPVASIDNLLVKIDAAGPEFRRQGVRVVDEHFSSFIESSGS